MYFHSKPALNGKYEKGSKDRKEDMKREKLPLLIFVSTPFPPLEIQEVLKIAHLKTSKEVFFLIIATFLDKYGFILIKSPTNCNEGWFHFVLSDEYRWL